jgi:hypothetical protein
MIATTGRAGNSRSRPGFMRAAARTLPVDLLGFLLAHNLDQAFAEVPQRVIDILTGKIAVPIRLSGGLVVARQPTNTVPVLATPGPLNLNGVNFWVQPGDPRATNPGAVLEGDVWIKI